MASRSAAAAPPLRDIVLLGGGHANVQVLRAFAMRPEPGLRLTVVAREPHSPYSGMLPGLVAGYYRWEDIHIDVARLAAVAGARFIAAEAIGLDLAAGRVALRGRPPLRYDALAINTGGVPADAPKADFVTAVKPIGRFLPIWERITADPNIERLAIVGGGPAGVELALAIAKSEPRRRCLVLEASPTLLPSLPRRARARLLGALRQRGVEFACGAEVRTAADGELAAADGRRWQADHVLWATGVGAPRWLGASGLATDAEGFATVGRSLQSTSHPEIFAAGDVASIVGAERPKSGVYAVRQGPVLAANLRRFALGQPLRRYRPQRRALAIVGLADGRAVAARGRWQLGGATVWRWKRWLDARFMRRFAELPPMQLSEPRLPPALQADAPPPMRCGGCGAKVGADALARVLARLDVAGDGAPPASRVEDAAVVQVAAGQLAMSCDGFRAMVDDGYRFGRIAAHHALNDLFAMGAEPTFALALATVPLMSAAMMEEDLYQMMAGALAVFREHGVALVGGHSAEGAEPGLAFSVTGTLREAAFAKGGLTAGERLVLTKPIGTGVVLSAAMQGGAEARQVLAAIAGMDTSNAAAATVLRRHGAKGCTDVTGFGLAGHLTEMTRAAGVGARLQATAVPQLPGAERLLAAGFASSLQENNEQALADFSVQGGAPNAPVVRLLADPQTAGGLLAGVPADATADCVAELRRCGYPKAAAIGTVTDGQLSIELRGDADG